MGIEKEKREQADGGPQQPPGKQAKTGDLLVEQVQSVEREVTKLISTCPPPHELEKAKIAIADIKNLIKEGVAGLSNQDKSDILLPVKGLMPALLAAVATADPSDLLTLTQKLSENLEDQKKDVDKALLATAKAVAEAAASSSVVRVGGGKKRTKRRVKKHTKHKKTKRRVKKHKKTKRRVKKHKKTKHKRTRHK
jgi:hypothetical protein